MCSCTLSPPPPQVKQKGGNVYENLTPIMFCDFTLIYAKLCTLIIFPAKWHVLVWKVIKMNYNIKLNLFSIFQVNLQFSV